MMTKTHITVAYYSLTRRMSQLQSVDNSLPRITLPHKAVERLRRENVKQAINEHQKQRNYKGPLIIACKRKEFNHFYGQTYSDFNPQQLASGNWKSTKSKGDRFTINSYKSNPALEAEVENFSELGLSAGIIDRLQRMNILVPTLIQSRTIPAVLSGKNVLCAAETGSGKTLAYLLPVVHNIEQKSTRPRRQDVNEPSVVILAPSKELVSQIYSVAEQLIAGASVPLVVHKACGGDVQDEFSTGRVDIVISTPGTFGRLLKEKVYRLRRLSHMVLDEADSLLDDSFNVLLKGILKRMKISCVEMPAEDVDGDAEGKREMDSAYAGVQVMLVGATVPTSLEQILGELVPVETIEKVTTPYLHRIMPHVSQKFLRLGSAQKPLEIIQMAKHNESKRRPSIIFCNKTSTAAFVAGILTDNYVGNALMHGRMENDERFSAYEKFREGKLVFNLVCTDVVSRGLDTVKVQEVINYDFPSFMSDYIHRVGRVGRVGSVQGGLVTSFINKPWEVDLLWHIEAAARRVTLLHNVNANIKRKLRGRAETKQLREEMANEEQ